MQPELTPLRLVLFVVLVFCVSLGGAALLEPKPPVKPQPVRYVLGTAPTATVRPSGALSF